LFGFAFNNWACWLDRSCPGLVLEDSKMLHQEKGEAPKLSMSARQATEVVYQSRERKKTEVNASDKDCERDMVQKFAVSSPDAHGPTKEKNE